MADKLNLDRFQKFLIDHESKDSNLAKRIFELVPSDRIEVVKGSPFQRPSGPLDATEYEESKKSIYVTPFRGHFFKRCPGARPGLSCCNYFVLNWGQQCDMDCSYCYLQSFLNFPALTLYSNLDQAIEELREIHQQMGDQSVRVGTGETVDSLSLDPLTLYSRELIETFRDFPNWKLEFKTKSDYVDQFLETPHAGNVICSWSINPEEVVSKEEHKTASLKNRLLAAKKCLDHGFLIAFHIDPMIAFDGWEEAYQALVNEVTSLFTPSDLQYISVGALRFQREQRHLMRERFGMKSLVTSGEVFQSSDGKLRYSKDLRQKMYKHVRESFLKDSSDWRLFMCMETPETWLQTFGHVPQKDEKLGELFTSKPIQSHRKILKESEVTADSR